MDAMHQAADEAINVLKHKTRQRRRIERDTLLGVSGHEELLRRHRKGSKLADAHSRRIAKKLWTVSRWAVMERALNECGNSEAEIEEMMTELMGAFKMSEAEARRNGSRFAMLGCGGELQLMPMPRPKRWRRGC
jgi:hypothetical protein